MHTTRRAYEELRLGNVAPSMADRQRIWLIEPSDSVATVEFSLVRVREMLRLVETSATFSAGTIADRVSTQRAALSDLVVAAQQRLDDAHATRLPVCGGMRSHPNFHYRAQ